MKRNAVVTGKNEGILRWVYWYIAAQRCGQSDFDLDYVLSYKSIIKCIKKTQSYTSRLYQECCGLACYLESLAGVWSRSRCRSLSFEEGSDSGPYLFYLDLCVVVLQCI